MPHFWLPGCLLFRGGDAVLAGVEEFCDEFGEACGVVAGGGEEVQLCRGEAGAEVFDEEVDAHLDGGERGFEFVGDAGDESGLGFVDLAKLGGIDEDDGDTGDFAGIVEEGDGMREKEKFASLVEDLDGGFVSAWVDAGAGFSGFADHSDEPLVREFVDGDIGLQVEHVGGELIGEFDTSIAGHDGDAVGERVDGQLGCRLNSAEAIVVQLSELLKGESQGVESAGEGGDFVIAVDLDGVVEVSGLESFGGSGEGIEGMEDAAVEDEVKDSGEEEAEEEGEDDVVSGGEFEKEAGGDEDGDQCAIGEEYFAAKSWRAAVILSGLGVRRLVGFRFHISFGGARGWRRRYPV